MYTMLEHEQMLTNVEAAVREAMQFYSDKSREEKYKDDVENHPLNIPLNVIIDHVRHIITNTYFCNSLTIIKQNRGLPMGTNAAPIIANLTLYIVEAAYIDTLIVTRNFAMARTFADMVRYIDDVGTWDNEPLPQAKYGIE